MLGTSSLLLDTESSQRDKKSDLVQRDTLSGMLGTSSLLLDTESGQPGNLLATPDILSPQQGTESPRVDNWSLLSDTELILSDTG